MEVVPVFQPFGQCLDRRFRRGIETAQCFRGSDAKAKLLVLEARAEGGEDFSFVPSILARASAAVSRDMAPLPSLKRVSSCGTAALARGPNSPRVRAAP